MTRIHTKPAGITSRLRKAKARKDAAYAKKIRDAVKERDWACRVYMAAVKGCDDVRGDGIPPCIPGQEWAHLGDKKRFKTRGMKPEKRHTTAGSLMLCTRHHAMYDRGEIAIIGDDANGPLEFRQIHAGGRRGSR